MFQSKSKLFTVLAASVVVAVYLACDSGIDNATTRIALFTDPQTGFSASDVRDADGQIVQFDAESGTLIWAAGRRAFGGWEVDGNEVQGKRHLRVRFGQKDGRQRAYLTDFDTGALVDVEVKDERLEIIRTQMQVPGGSGGAGGGPTLILEPTSGPPGTSVAVAGRGFAGRTCGANLYFDSLEGQLLGFALAEVGTFTATITVPATAAPGEHKVIAQGLVQGQEFCDIASDDVVEAPFTVTEVGRGPFVSVPAIPDVFEADLREFPTLDPWRPGDPILELPRPDRDFDAPGESSVRPTASDKVSSALLPSETPAVAALSPPLVDFEGIPGTGAQVPDTVGAVGPDHYVQMVNAAMAIYDKQGTLLAGPFNINTLWNGFGGPCEDTNWGDPIVQYDQLADRWLVSQFAFDLVGGFIVPPYVECIAISRTPDPVTGGWFRYGFQMTATGLPTGTPTFPDYPKFGVWPDAYYMTTYEGANLGLFAFDRTSMLGGAPSRYIRFAIPSLALGRPQTRILPSDVDGPPPPPGSPNWFVRSVDGNLQGGGADRLELFQFQVDPVDFVTGAGLSTLTGPETVATAPYDIEMCGTLLPRDCIPQPGTTQGLDPLSNRLIRRLQYRNFASHETIVASQTVDVGDFDDHAGIRWYELRRAPGGVWFVFQQGTYSPDATNRWMGGAAMDVEGNIALAYSVSTETVFPGIRYTGRLAADPLGTLPQGEAVLVTGGGSQTFGPRWGDYTSMDVDPVSPCTFWFTSEYYATTSLVGWQTRIASFTLNEPPTIDCPEDQTVECDGEGNGGELDDWLNSATATDDCDGTVSNDFAELTDGCAHTGASTVTFTAEDCCSESASCSATLTITDSEAPQVEPGSAIEIWPPNHKYREFDLSDCVESVTDACDGALDVDMVGNITSIYSDEPEDVGGGGDGRTLEDIVILSNSAFKVRAERQGGGNGRVYGVTFDVTDCAGNVETATCLITVPHDQSGATAVDDGPGAGYTLP